MTNSKRPITKPEDLEGLKLRVIPNPVFLDTFRAFKANPVPMPFAELYGALESKAVDGQENPFAVILSNKFYEVQKYVSATNHVYAANIMLVSKRFWDKLSPAEQKMMNDAANEARDYQRQVSRAAAQKAVGELQAKGMQYNELAPAEQARMRQIAKPVTERSPRATTRRPSSSTTRNWRASASDTVRHTSEHPMKILVLHGPNLNLFGRREPHIYGTTTLAQIDEQARRAGRELGVELETLQSNHEGVLVDKLHECIDAARARCSTRPG